ncbi:MAG: AAA family ATPase [Thiotrichales bacterium]|nr:MAG: AAA family ATPase [Thiotrichales bacterium]
MPEQKDLELLIHGHTPILLIETHEEMRALDLLVGIATRNVIPLFKWSVTEGLRRVDIDLGVQRHNAEPRDVLAHIKASEVDGIYVLLDFDPYIQEPVNERFIKEIAMQFEGGRNKLVFISHRIELPSGLSKRVARFELRLPDARELEQLIRDEAGKWQIESGRQITTESRTLRRLLHNLRGLTFNDARRLIRNVIVDDGAITEDDLPEVMRAKYQLLNRDDVLSYEFETTRFSDVGGMRNLKRWLQQREKIFHGLIDQVGIDKPRGLLLLGVQGCGKSLAAKAIAGVWNVPLLRFDFGALYDKYIGESEKNLRESLKTAEVMAPCVMWIDEIEKGISGGNDEGTSKRILGALLTWLAENRANVFIVATANNIDELPPELIRKGRLDEIFFVDLPKQDIRKQVFAIHLAKREIPQSGINLDQLAIETEGYSGSEIEQAVVSAIYSSYGSDEAVTTQVLLQEIRSTRPLSVVMDAQIQQLRQWAASRTVAVD